MTQKTIEINDLQVTLYAGVTCEDVCKVVSDFFICGCRGKMLEKVYNLENVVYIEREKKKALVIL